MSKTQNYMPRDGSARNSPRGSMGSDDNNLDFETYDVDADTKGDLESKIAADLQTFNELDQSPIFRQLCPKKNYEDRPNCKVCNKSFKFMNKKKSCKFCGGSICEEHGKKKRPNPENTSEYVRVCDICDEQYIQRSILAEFKVKLDKKMSALEKLESQIKEQEFRIGDSQKEYDQLCLKKTRNDKNYSEQMKFLTNDIAKGKEESKKSEKENAELTKELQKTQKKVEDLDLELVQSEKEYEKLSKEAAELTIQIEALNQDISQMNKTIRNMEEVISQHQAQNKPAPQPQPQPQAQAPVQVQAVIQENNVIPSVPSLKSIDAPSIKEYETPIKDESSYLSSPRELTVSEPTTIESKTETKPVEAKPVETKLVEETPAPNEAKRSMSRPVPRMVKNSMIKSSQAESSVKSNNCNTGCNMF